MINDHSNRNQRLKAAYESTSLKPETKIPSIHKTRLSFDLKKSPKPKPKQHSNKTNLKPNLDTSLLIERASNTHRQLSGIHSTKAAKNTSLILDSPYNSSNLLISRKFSARGKAVSTNGPEDLKLPMKGPDVLKLKSQSLTDYESKEVALFEEVYFLGNIANKIRAVDSGQNSGYDDEELDYRVVIGDHIYYRFEVLQIVGKGSFGQVCKCLDHKTSQIVALKIIKNKQKFHRQGAVEVKVLKHLNDSDPEDSQNIVRILSSFTFRSHLCIVFELLSINLYEFLKINRFQGLSLALVRCFAVQILIALRFTSMNDIVHCDLKPENILLKTPTRAAIKIIDYGSSCFTPEQIYTYIQSRFYRAPEIMLGIPYTPAIDIWSYGCILLELYTGYPLFPGESENDQMLRIMEILGPPPADLLKNSARKKHFFDPEDQPKLIPNSKGKIRVPGSRPLNELITVSEPSFLHFIKETLTWDPRLRPSAEKLMTHPWILETNTRKSRKANSYFN